MSKNDLISPSTNQFTPPQFLISFRAVWHPLLGLNPCEVFRNFPSNIVSITIFIDCWMILSRGLPTPRGLVLPFGLGISTLLTGLGIYVSFSRSSEVELNHPRFIPSRVSESIPSVMLPGLLLMSL